MTATTPRHYLGLCAIAKDETPFLREWVAHHHLIGFERIFIYDNDSATPVRDVVADMYDARMLDTYTIQGRQMQLVAYNHCLRTHGHECEWMAFFDLDEFLLLHDEDDARAFCAGYEAYSGIAINWNRFGSSGHLKRPPGLVLENYRECFGPDPSVKCIVRPARVAMPLSPHHFIFTQGYAVNADGIPALGGHAPVPAGKALINHYVFRSQQDYEDKIRRGDAIFVGFDPRPMTNFYTQAKERGEEHGAIRRHIPRVKRIVEEGRPAPYRELDSREALAEPYAASLARMAAALENNTPELARLVFLLGRSRFGGKPGYLALGGKACRACGDGVNARRAALDLVAASPTLASFLELLLASALCGDRQETERLAAFLLDRAAAEGDASVAETVRAAMAAPEPQPL